ncbi:hypothetical protein IJ102_02965 [Candidatus Saccharibacteria bacterium]|nr:hypothetical protein [Candidatus Saccharibacteria bacterium]
MQKFGDDFLESVGLSALPEAQRAGFLEYAQDQFEMRIGKKMSEGMTNDQLDEFSRIAENDEATIQAQLAQAGDYKNSQIYQSLLNNGGVDGSKEILNDFVTATWLNKNCPNYAQILETVLQDLQAEIRSQKDAILAAV